MYSDFNEEPLTEDEVISILGNNYRVQGNELVWKCPACPGGDKSGDNLKFNKQKGILKCFACNYGNEITSILYRRRYNKKIKINYTHKCQEYTQTTPPIEVEKEIPAEELDQYYWNCHVALMKRKDILRQMFEKHTIMPKTAADCLIGYDIDKDKLVFPSKAIGADPTEALYQTTPNGAEYREYKGEKIIMRVKGYEPKICSVYATGFTMQAVICEGYKDAYNLIQIMKITEPKELSYTAIFTVQNGTNSINANNCLQKSDWNRFDEVKLLMDNDKAGDKATELAQSFFPKMIDYRPQFLKNYNDVQSKFKQEYAPMINIERALEAQWLKEYEKESLVY